jgi:hypothetical protein
LHCERTATFEDFIQELHEWERLCGLRVAGFTKHGSGEQKLSRKHHPQYEVDKLMGYAERAGLKYFVGNGVDYREKWDRRDGVIYIPSVYWPDYPPFYSPSHTVNEVIRAAESYPVVVLIHPVWWYMRKEVRNELELLISHFDFIPLKQAMFSVLG